MIHSAANRHERRYRRRRWRRRKRRRHGRSRFGRWCRYGGGRWLRRRRNRRSRRRLGGWCWFRRPRWYGCPCRRWCRYRGRRPRGRGRPGGNCCPGGHGRPSWGCRGSWRCRRGRRGSSGLPTKQPSKFGRGYCEPDSRHGPAALGLHYPQSVDADRFSGKVYQRAAAVAGVESRVRLEQVDAVDVPHRRYDAPRHSQGYIEPLGERRVAQRQHLVAQTHLSCVSHCQRGERASALYPHRSKVSTIVPRQHLAAVTTPIGQNDLHAVETVYHVAVRNK